MKNQKIYTGKRLLIYQVDSPYDALRNFMNRLIEAFYDMGIDLTIIDFMQKDAMEQLGRIISEHFDAVFSFNSHIANIRLSSGAYLQDYIQAPYYYFLVDHPMHHHKILCEKLNDFHTFCVDYHFIDYIHTYYPHIKSVNMIPHAGHETGVSTPYLERKTDVLFTGSYKDCDELLALIEHSEEPARTLSTLLIKELLTHTDLRQEEAFSNVLQQMGLKIEREQFAEWLSIIGNVTDHYIRGVYRNKMIEAMANEPYEVEIYGNNWDKTSIHAPNLHFHEAVSYEENQELMNNAKIVLNTYTGFKNGAHERIFDTLLAGSVCLTDTNTYLKNNFKDREQLVIFSYDDMENYQKILKHYLKHPQEAAVIAKCGYDIAKQKHTWTNRAEQIAQIIFHEKEN